MAPPTTTSSIPRFIPKRQPSGKKPAMTTAPPASAIIVESPRAKASISRPTLGARRTIPMPKASFVPRFVPKQQQSEGLSEMVAAPPVAVIVEPPRAKASIPQPTLGARRTLPMPKASFVRRLVPTEQQSEGILEMAAEPPVSRIIAPPRAKTSIPQPTLGARSKMPMPKASFVPRLVPKQQEYEGLSEMAAEPSVKASIPQPTPGARSKVLLSKASPAPRVVQVPKQKPSAIRPVRTAAPPASKIKQRVVPKRKVAAPKRYVVVKQGASQRDTPELTESEILHRLEAYENTLANMSYTELPSYEDMEDILVPSSPTSAPPPDESEFLADLDAFEKIMGEFETRRWNLDDRIVSYEDILNDVALEDTSYTELPDFEDMEDILVPSSPIPDSLPEEFIPRSQPVYTVAPEILDRIEGFEEGLGNVSYIELPDYEDMADYLVPLSPY